MDTGAPRSAQPLGRTDLALVLAFWTLFALLMTANRLWDPRALPALGGGPPPASIAASTAFAISFAEAYLWAAATLLVFWLASRYPIEAPDRLSRLALFAGVGALAVIAVGVIMSALQRQVSDVVTPLVRGPLGGRGGRGGRGGFGAGGPPTGAPRSLLAIAPGRVLNDTVVYIGIVAAAFARDYFMRYRARQAESVRLQAEAARLHAALADARLAALRTQLNPHFLFNTLHAVSSLVERDPRGVRRMIARLSDLLRLTLDDEAPEQVTLEQELAYLEKYLEIMRIRFQDSLEVVIEVDPAVRGANVPQLILQPLVENAVKHGVGQVDGGGRIEIRARRLGDRVLVSIRDTGPGAETARAPEGEGVGLRNTRERLAQLYGEAQSLTLRPADGGGTIVELTLPFARASRPADIDSGVKPGPVAPPGS